MVLEYYLTGGRLRIGKKELTLELLRKDSILRSLLGYGAGDLKSLVSGAATTAEQDAFVTLDFGGTSERKLSDDPNQSLKELKRRYGSQVGGKLYFKIMYTTFSQVFYSEANLDSDDISVDISK